MKKQCRWQEKTGKRSGATVTGFDTPGALLFHYPSDAAKTRSGIFAKLDFRTTKACAPFIADAGFISRQTFQLSGDRP
jgi:hypothetical protein